MNIFGHRIGSAGSDDRKPAGPTEGRIIVYSSVICGFCRAARRLLDQKGWDYTVLGVDGNAGRRREMMDLSGGHTVPQIFFGQHHIGGFDDIAALEAAGELDALYDEYIKGA